MKGYLVVAGGCLAGLGVHPALAFHVPLPHRDSAPSRVGARPNTCALNARNRLDKFDDLNSLVSREEIISFVGINALLAAVWGPYASLQEEKAKGLLQDFWKVMEQPNLRNILEVGIGGKPGLAGFQNMDFYVAGQQVTGVDPYFPVEGAPELKAAQERARNRQVSLSGVRGVAENLPFPSNSFDAVVMTRTLCTVQDPQQAITEVARVLRPGGKFVFVEHVEADDPNHRWFGLRAQQNALDPIQQIIAGGCHLNRPTDKMILASTEAGATQRLFSSVERFDRHQIGSRWPASEQLFGVVVK